MKTYVTYGFIMTVATALLTLVLFFLGYHSDAAKLSSAQWIGSLGGLAIATIVIVLGTRARRTEIPAAEPFGYGRALGTGVMIALFAALFGIVFNYVYMQLINPGMVDLIVQAQSDKMAARGLSSTQIEQAEKMIRFMTGPVMSSIVGFIMGVFWGTLISLITAAILKRPAPAEPIAAA